MRAVRAAWIEYAEALLVAVLLATFARTFVVQVFRIPTESMEPSLEVGDHVLVDKVAFGPTRWDWERYVVPVRSPKRGDVIVFRAPTDPPQSFVKRCVATEGDRVRLHRKRLILDGAVVEEPFVNHSDDRTYPDSPFLDEYFRRRDNYGPLIVPGGHMFVLGDNRDLSNDSRFWGPVRLDAIQGRAVLIAFSVGPGREDPGTGVRWSRWLSVVR